MENMENTEVMESTEVMENNAAHDSGAEAVGEAVADGAEAPKTYTQEEVNEIVGRRLARAEAKRSRENERKYGALIETLKAGTGKKTVEELTETFADFYKQQGIEVKQKPELSGKDLEVLARSDAEEFIRMGDEEVAEEVNRLAKLGLGGMSARERAMFRVLATHRRRAEQTKTLTRMGVGEDVSGSAEFLAFAEKFVKDTPITEIYDLYKKSKPKKEIKPMGSMKNTASADGGVKDYYSPEEAKRFTLQDFNRDPKLYKRVMESMKQWPKA